MALCKRIPLVWPLGTKRNRSVYNTHWPFSKNISALRSGSKGKKLTLISTFHTRSPGRPRVRPSLRSYLSLLAESCQLQHLKFRINQAMNVCLMTPCCLVGGYQIFGGAIRLGYIQRNLPPTDNRVTNLTLRATFTVTFLHDRHNSFSLITSVSMKMEAEKSYETSVSAYDPTPCQYPEDHHLSNASSKSLKIYLNLTTTIPYTSIHSHQRHWKFNCLSDWASG